MLIYVNGVYVKDTEAVISPYDHGFLYGMGVFETFRMYKGHPFLFDAHYERLMRSLQSLCITWRMSKEQVLAVLQQLLQRNGIGDAYIRLNVSAGMGEIGLQTDWYEEPSVIIFIKPLPVAEEIVEKEGVFLQTPRNTPEGDWRLKSHHYLNNIIGKREVGNDPLKEGIFFTREGYVAEGVVSNLFFVKNHVLCTPALETGILNGVTRNFVLQLAQSLQIETREGLFLQDDLLTSDEVFVTNSIQEIVPLHKIGTVQFPGKNGAVTSRLIRAYRLQRSHV